MHVVIIGNGIAGITAARTIRKLDPDVQISVISKESKYFFSRTALMYVYMGHMKFEHTQPYENWFWEKNRIGLIFDEVRSVDFENQLLHLKHSKLEYDQLILATGSKPNKFGWPGENLNGVRGLYSKQDLEYLEKQTPNIDRAVIVGGGLIGVELAEMLLSRGKKVTFLVREDRFWGSILGTDEARMIGKHMVEDHHVEIHYNSNLGEIISDERGWVKAVRVKETGEEIPCQYVGLTAGVSPNIDFLKNSKLELDKGILVDQYLSTNQPHVFAIGDCAQIRNPLANRKSIEPIWYTGRMMGECVAHTVVGHPTKYNPGPWFNSAKFMDIEYQTYGQVPAIVEDPLVEFVWQHPTEYILLRLVYEKNSDLFVGVNAFGLRLRHSHFDAWLRTGKTVSFVLAHLADANFDPEFSKNHAMDIVQAFNKQTGAHIKLRRRSWKRILKLNPA